MRLMGSGFDIPPEVADRVDFHWFHVPVGGSLNLCLLPPKPVWYVAHWVGGRMIPCEKDDCRYCAEGLGTQIRYVLSVVEITTRQPGLIELGKTNGLLIRDWGGCDGYPTWVAFEVYRPGRAKQSRLDVRRLEQSCLPWAMRVPMPDPVAALEATWEKLTNGVHTHQRAAP
jgi:hypothetical protein